MFWIKLGSDVPIQRTSKQNYSSWNHPKIISRIWIIVRLVIWTIFNLQSVCTYQILFYVILLCSTCSKDSRDYKIIKFGQVELILWIKWPKQVILALLKLCQKHLQNMYRFFAYLIRACYKLSKTYLFAIFGQVLDFISIYKVWYQIWHLN